MDEQKLIHYLKSLVHLEPDKNWFFSARDNLEKYMKRTSHFQPFSGWKGLFFLRNLKLAAGAAVLIFMLSTGTGSVFASQESLPGDVLFPVKLFTEQVEKFLAQDEAKKVELNIKFADRRLQEIVTLSATPQAEDGGKGEITKNLERFRLEIQDGEKNLVKIDVKEKKDEMTLKLVLKFEGGLGKYQEILAGLEEVLPAGPARDAIRLAREASERGEAVSFKMALKIEGQEEEEEEDEEEGVDDEDEHEAEEGKPASGIERLEGKIGAASHKISKVEQKISREQEKNGEAFVAPAKEKLEEAKKILADLKTLLAGTPSSNELEEAFRKVQEVIRIAEDAKRLLHEDNEGHNEKRKIEVEVEDGQAKVKIETGENKSEFTLPTISREEIVAKILEVTGLSREEVEDVMKFEIEEEENNEENNGG